MICHEYSTCHFVCRFVSLSVVGDVIRCNQHNWRMLLCVVVQCFWVLYQEKMVKEDDFLHICGQNIGHFGSRCNTGLALVWYSACILHIVSTKCITVYSVLTPWFLFVVMDSWIAYRSRLPVPWQCAQGWSALLWLLFEIWGNAWGTSWPHLGSVPKAGVLCDCTLKLGAIHGVHRDHTLAMCQRLERFMTALWNWGQYMEYIVTTPWQCAKGWSVLWLHFEIGGNAWSTSWRLISRHSVVSIMHVHWLPRPSISHKLVCLYMSGGDHFCLDGERCLQ